MGHTAGERLAFCTLGMLIIDEIDYSGNKEKEENVLGGAGTYAAVGARIAAGQRNASLVSWMVDRGSDFPNELMAVIDSWQTSCVFRTNLNRLTTRAWNGYGPNQDRAFKYLTPKQRLEASDLNDDQIMASSFHMVCSPTRCIELRSSIYRRRAELDVDADVPVEVWEPVPDLCTPAELNNLQAAAQGVRVVSPNGSELASFFQNQSGELDRKAMVEHVLGRQLGTGDIFPAFVVREGAEGSYLFMGEQQVHFRAYHQDSLHVVDPTGGGNTFLGALAIALTGKANPSAVVVNDLRGGIRSETLRTLMTFVCAVVHATIAASFAIEQVGMPQVEQSQPDIWNGQSYTRRFHDYMERERSYLAHQLKDWPPPDEGR